MHTRRHWLRTASLGFGSLALSSLLRSNAGAGAAAPQFRARAKNVIFLFMDGGVSHLDSFDPKPRLQAEAGKRFPMKIEATQFDSNGPIFASPWTAQASGQCGLQITDLFPHIRNHADDLCILRSMTNESAVHANAIYWMHNGWGMMGRPCMGAWISYALGSENQNLPAFVVLNGGMTPLGGIESFRNNFLPAAHQATVFDRVDDPVANVRPALAQRQAGKLEFIAQRDRALAAQLGHADGVDAAIRNYELAARMQAAVPDLTELAGETDATKSLYGFDHPNEHTRTYARQCLTARRLVERGVRFVELTIPRVMGEDRWDAHGNLKQNHTNHALAVDQPIAALLKDLKARGLWEETLVVFATEFGRTPFTQGNDGRDHNQFGFSVWLAGGGVKGGFAYGETDEYGYKVVSNPLKIHDFHATLLHLLGLNHEKTTYPFNGRDFRLTDVHGKVVHEILA